MQQRTAAQGKLGPEASARVLVRLNLDRRAGKIELRKAWTAVVRTGDAYFCQEWH
jgi:hypothetical protein